jgi:hypothetical protein
MGETAIYNPGCDCGGAFLSGTVPPIAAQGENGDFYLDFTLYNLYGPKTAGLWPEPPVSIVGPDGVGAMGPAGPAGQQGIQGPKGVKGDPGTEGLSAYDVWLAEGNVGTEADFLLDITGPTGVAGPAGSQIFSDVVDPVNVDGDPGDYWLNTTTSTLWGPKDVATFWVGTDLLLKGDTGDVGPAGADGADGADQPILDLHCGQQNVTNNTTTIAIPAAADPTLHNPADYIQLTGIFDAVPHGVNNGVTQQSNQLTIARSGTYRIAVWCTFTTSTNATSVGLRFALNGVVGLARTPRNRVSTANDRRQIVAHGIHNFAAGDIITLWGAADTGTNVTFEDMVFSVVELIATGIETEVQDEGTPILTAADAINFVGAGVTVTDVAGVATVTIPGGGGGGSLDVEDEGISIDAAVVVMDFVGAGVTVTQTVAGEVEVNIPGTDTNTTDLVVQEEGVTVVIGDTLNFVGASVTVTDVGGVATVTVTDADTNTTDLIVNDEGTPIVTTDEINFVGAGVTVTDVAGVATVTIPGGGGGATKHLLRLPVDPVNGTNFAADFFGGISFLVTEDCTITDIGIIASGAFASTTVYPAVYAKHASTNSLGALLATGSLVTGLTAGVNLIPLTSGLVVTAGTLLWIGLITHVATAMFASVSNTTPVVFFAAAGAPPDPAPATTHTNAAWGSFWPVVTT